MEMNFWKIEKKNLPSFGFWLYQLGVKCAPFQRYSHFLKLIYNWNTLQKTQVSKCKSYPTITKKTKQKRIIKSVHKLFMVWKYFGLWLYFPAQKITNDFLPFRMVFSSTNKSNCWTNLSILTKSWFRSNFPV